MNSFPAPFLPRGRACAALLCGAVLALASLAAGAQVNAALDSSFDGDGRLDIKFVAGGSDDATLMVNYPGRRYLTIGQCSGSGGAIPCLARLNEDGSADSSFGSNGLVSTQFIAGYTMSSTAVAVQSDGKILVAGTCTATATGAVRACHVRLLASGQLDTSYASSGGAVVPVGANSASYGNAIAVQSDGKIVLGGACLDSSFAFCTWRYNASGALETGYGGTGSARVGVTAGGVSVAGMLMAADNTVILYGSCSNAGIYNACLVRLSIGGSRDILYVGGTGAPILAHYTSGSGIYEGVRQAVLRPDGSVVLAAYCVSGTTLRVCAARVTAAGALDTSFAGSGWSVPTHNALGAQSMGAGIALQRDGKVVLTVGCVNRYNVCTLRLNNDGSLDSGYGQGGVMTVTGPGGYATNVGGALLDSDERLLIAGGCYGNDGGGITDSCYWRLQRYAGRLCSLDIDDDGTPLAANDVLLLARAALGFSGSNALAGITFGSNAQRTTWPAIRNYLFSQCGMTGVR